MKITVKVKTRAKTEKVEKVGDIYKVSVKQLPIEGQANEAVIKALADHFNVAPTRIRLITGQTNKQKVFEIL